MGHYLSKYGWKWECVLSDYKIKQYSKAFNIPSGTTFNSVQEWLDSMVGKKQL